MINKSQHLMIFALYTLFSVFLGIIFITLSDSFFVGAGSFFSFFLGFTTYHLFWLGRKVVGRMAGVAKIVNTLDTNRNNYEQDIKSVRDIIDNMTEIINTLINNNDSIEEHITQQQEKNDMYLTKIHEQMEFMQNNFQTKINDLESQNNRLVSAIDRLALSSTNSPSAYVAPKPSQNYDSISEFDDSFIQEDFMNLSNNIHVGKINEHKSIYDVRHTPEKNSYSPPPRPHPEHSDTNDMLDNHNFADDFHAIKQNTHTNTPSNNGFEFDEDGFLNFDTDDDSFSTLSLPQNIHLNNANPPERKMNTPQTQEQITEQFDDEFSTIDPHISDNYAHLLQTDHDETFYETFDDYHTKIIREQINTAPPSASENAQQHNTDIINDEDDEDSFVDITHNINTDFTDNPETEDFDIPLSEQQPVDTMSANSAVPQQSTEHLKPTTPMLPTQALPSLAELAPDIQLNKIAKRQKITQTNVPPLDSILNKPLKQKTASKIPQDSLDDNFDDMNYQLPTEPTDDTEQNKSSDTNRETPNNQNTLADTIRTAINTNSLTLFTAPVTDYRVREIKFFENYLYLPQGNNQFIPHFDFVPLGRKKAMSIDIDRIMITQTIRLSNYLKKDVPDVGIFCNISLHSITDAHFEMELYQLLSNKRETNQHLIFSFPQEELQALTSIQIEKILHFSDMGIRFCVDNIYNILPDLTELSRIGIGFIKLRISDFAKGIYANHQIYKGNQIQEICHKSNILLYIKDVNTHEDLLQAVENQADLLQGDLLGEKDRSELLEEYLA